MGMEVQRNIVNLKTTCMKSVNSNKINWDDYVVIYMDNFNSMYLQNKENT